MARFNQIARNEQIIEEFISLLSYGTKDEMQECVKWCKEHQESLETNSSIRPMYKSLAAIFRKEVKAF